MSYNLFIDDERVPMDVKWGTWQDQALYRDADWVIARNWGDVLEIVLTFGFPKLISFDHDLGEDEKTGYEIARKLCDMIMDGIPLPENFDYMVHSKNPVGAQNISNYMESFLKYYGD
jgi:hypothetical protein